MRAFFAEPNTVKADGIAARQAWLLNQHLKPRVGDLGHCDNLASIGISFVREAFWRGLNMRAWVVVLSLLAMLMACGGAQAERRVALVIGNSHYTGLPPVKNPGGDAEAMAALLKNVGFDVLKGIDLTAVQMSERLREFGKEANGADVALLYYAGQGLAVHDVSYLLPVDIRINSEIDLKLGGAVDLETAANETMKGACARLVFFDAGRTNPFESGDRPLVRRSLPDDPDDRCSAGGSMMAFASGPAQVAEDGSEGHSPFTRALLENIAAPGVEIQEAMRKVRVAMVEYTGRQQMPWWSTNMIGMFYLNPAASAAGKK
jgi:uncharacterized caspase-like protein